MGHDPPFRSLVFTVDADHVMNQPLCTQATEMIHITRPYTRITVNRNVSVVFLDQRKSVVHL